MKNSALMLAFLFWLSFNAFAQNETVTKNKIHPEEYNVYKTVLEGFLKSPTNKQLVIRKFTSGIENSAVNNDRDRKAMLLKIFEPETVERYDLLHNKPFELKNEFGIKMPVNLVTDEELKPIFDKEKQKDLTEKGKQDLEKQYQTTTIITFSRVSFDKGGTRALLHVDYICGMGCSRGFIYIVGKSDNRWTVWETLHTRIHI